MSNCGCNNDLFGSFKEAGIKNNLKDALEDVGLQISSDVCLWEYPEIIRKNLIAKDTPTSDFGFKDSDTVSFEIDDYKNVTANIECITFEQIDAL